LPSYFATFSPISILDVLTDFFACFDFLQTLQVYMIVILFVDFVFLFQDFIAGLLNLPWFPVPLLNPRLLTLELDQRDIGCEVDLPLCLAMLIVCAVCFPQCLQYLFVSFGNFISVLGQKPGAL